MSLNLLKQASSTIFDKNSPKEQLKNQKPDNLINGLSKFDKKVLTENTKTRGTTYLINEARKRQKILRSKDPIYMAIEQNKVDPTDDNNINYDNIAWYGEKSYFDLVVSWGLINFVTFYHIFTIFIFTFIGHEILFFTLMFLKFAPYFMDPNSELKNLFILSSNDFILPGESNFFDIFFIIAMFRSRFLRCFVIANQMFYPMLPFVSNLMSLIPTRIRNHARLEEIRKNINPYYFSLIDPYYFSLLYSYDNEIIFNTFAFLLSVISFRFAVWVTSMILAGVAFLNYVNRFLQNNPTQKQNLYSLGIVIIFLCMFVKLYEDTFLLFLIMFPYYIIEIILGIMPNLFCFIFL